MINKTSNSVIFKVWNGLFLASALLVFIAQSMIFLVVPTEKVMGAIQRIFYFHVGAAIACYVCFGIVLLASLFFLASRQHKWDDLNVAASEVGFVMCTVVLVSGMIWAKTAWNVWFRWEPRLVTFLLLWLLSAGSLFIRRFSAFDKKEVHTSAIGILGASTVPLVWLSVHLLPQVAQLHPQVIEKGGLKDGRYIICFLLSTVALILLSVVLIFIRARIEKSFRRIEW
jgi:heme exporter protein C